MFNRSRLLMALDELEQHAQRVTPGPWHRVTNSVMRRQPAASRVPLLPMRTEPLPIPSEHFWDDVEMVEVHAIDPNKKEPGFIGHADREEDAAHFALFDREMLLWLIEDNRARLKSHTRAPDHDSCKLCLAHWPCPDALSVQQFVTHANLE